MADKQQKSIQDRLDDLEQSNLKLIDEVNRLHALHMLHGHDTQGKIFHYPNNG